MKMDNFQKNIIQASALTVAAAVLILLAEYVPIFYGLGIIILPLPFALVYIKNDFKYAAISLISAGLIAAIFSEPITAITLAITYGIVGIAMVYCIKNDQSVLTTIAVMAVVIFASTIYLYRFASMVTGQDLVKMWTEEIGRTIDSIKSSYPGNGFVGTGFNSIINGENLSSYIAKIIPAAVLVFSLIVSFITYRIAYIIFRKNGIQMKEPKGISQWYIQPKLTFILLILLGIAYVIGVSKGDRGDVYLYNTFLIFTFAYSVNGIAFLSNAIQKTRIPTFIRIIILIIIFVSPLSDILFFIGMIDYIFDFRKLSPRRMIK